MSFYIQLTTQCNMSCAHCIFRCSEDKRGDFMHPRTYAKAIKLAEQYGSGVCLGGGEPTLHPKFWEFFGKAMASSDIEWVWMATNGSKTELALALNAMTVEGGKFSCELSLDDYHDPIDQSVIDAFKRRDHSIRDVSERVSRTGSAEDNGIGVQDECHCTDIFVTPKGDMRLCGCLDGYSIGHIDTIDDELLDRANRVVQSLQCSRPSVMPKEYIEFIETGKELEEEL